MVGPTGHISWGAEDDVFPDPDAHNTVGAFLRFGDSVGGAGLTDAWSLASWVVDGGTTNLWKLFDDGSGNRVQFFGFSNHTGGNARLNFEAEDINGVWENGQFHFAGATNFGATHTGFLINSNIGIGTIGFSIDAGFGGNVGGLLALYQISNPPVGAPVDTGGKGAAWIWLATTTSNTDSQGVRIRFPNANEAIIPDVTGPLGLSCDTSIDIGNAIYLVTQLNLQNGGIMTFTSTPDLSADRTITFPLPLANRAYTRLVTMSDTDINGHNLIFSVGVGPTVSFSSFSSKFALLAFTSAGVFACNS